MRTWLHELQGGEPPARRPRGHLDIARMQLQAAAPPPPDDSSSDDGECAPTGRATRRGPPSWPRLSFGFVRSFALFLPSAVHPNINACSF